VDGVGEVDFAFVSKNLATTPAFKCKDSYGSDHKLCILNLNPGAAVQKHINLAGLAAGAALGLAAASAIAGAVQGMVGNHGTNSNTNNGCTC